MTQINGNPNGKSAALLFSPSICAIRDFVNPPKKHLEVDVVGAEERRCALRIARRTLYLDARIALRLVFEFDAMPT